MELIDQLFNPEEISAILSIPLSSTNQADALTWRGMAKGTLSVRSAYYIAKDMEVRRSPSSSGGRHNSEVWRQIWKLNVPNVEKNFIWRACHNILLTKERLHRKKITQDPHCPLCGLEAETSFHILWNCPSARDVWGACGRKIQKRVFEGLEFIQVMEGIITSCEEDDINLFGRVARKI